MVRAPGRRTSASWRRLVLAGAIILAVASCSSSELTTPAAAGGPTRGVPSGGAGDAPTVAAGGASQPNASGGAGGTATDAAGAAGAGDQGGAGGAASGGGTGIANENGGAPATGGISGSSGQPGTGGVGTAMGGSGPAGAGAPSGGAAGMIGSGGGGNSPAGSAGMGGAGVTGSGGSVTTGSGGAVITGSGGSVTTGSGGAVITGAGGSAAGGARGGTVAAVGSTNAAGTSITLVLDAPLADSAVGFFQSLGSNGRSCASCHLLDQGMSLTPAGATALFDSSDGTDPLFRPTDGAVSPLADVSTVAARRTAYAMLLSKGLIRVGLPVPANADFDLVGVSDPYGYASAAELSLFRRPLPAANLRFLSSVMWDGREGSATGSEAAAQLLDALSSQASHATLGHAQATMPLGSAGVAAIVNFELGVYSAQQSGATAGPLDALLATGGPVALTQQSFYAGINDASQAGASFDPNVFSPNVFSNFTAWASTTDQGADADARRQIALGEQLFNTRTFTVTGVNGLTTTAQPSATVTCSFCHDSPGAGSSSTPRFFDLGLTSGTRLTSDMPSYTLQERSTGTQVTVSDPGRALITGAFKDVSTFKVPTLRGLASRAPYFHNGAASSLTGVVAFYNGRFAIGLTADEKAALAAFLASL